MATIATEVIESKRDDRGRQIRAADEREALLRAYQESGLTQKAFAAREGVKYCTFVSWVQAAKRSAPSPAARFAEVSVTSAAASAHRGVEVVLPDGVVVRGGDMDAVIAVVNRLRRC